MLGRLLPVGLLAALPMHFFVGRVDDTVVAAPALAELGGGFGLLLLPVLWMAYIAVSALPMVICLAGTVAIAIAEAAGRPAPAARGLAPGGQSAASAVGLVRAVRVLTQSLPLLLTADRLGAAVAAPLAVTLGLVSTGVLTFTGLLGCVVLVDRRPAPRRATHLWRWHRGRPGGGLARGDRLPRLADAFAGGLVATVVAVVTALFWAVAALVTYAHARRGQGPVTSGSLWAELSAPGARLTAVGFQPPARWRFLALDPGSAKQVLGTRDC